MAINKVRRNSAFSDIKSYYINFGNISLQINCENSSSKLNFMHTNQKISIMHKISIVFILIGFVAIFSCEAQIQTGTASFYADHYEGKKTANGEKYKHKNFTAAHKFLPFGTIVKVTNIENGESVEVRINDRGPYIADRVIDLSRAAAEKLKFINQGLAEVKIEVIDAGDGRSGTNRPIQVDQNIDTRAYFEIKVERENPSGYGVQIGSFQGYENMLRLSENLKKSYRTSLIVEVKEINEQKIYALILGDFKKRKKADQLKLKLEDRFPDAFIKRF